MLLSPVNNRPVRFEPMNAADLRFSIEIWIICTLQSLGVSGILPHVADAQRLR